MKSVQIFDSVTSRGEDDSAIVADIEWAELTGGQVDRFDVAQRPEQVAEQAVVRDRLAAFGKDALPLTLVEGQIMLSGRYPTRAELARWMLDVTAPMGQLKPAAQSGGCCGGQGGGCDCG